MKYPPDAEIPAPKQKPESSPPHSSCFSKIPVQVRRSIRKQDEKADAIYKLEEELQDMVI